ncbi:MAG: alpha/beta fold hydrolase [Dehalococcoidia bacterium]
MPLEGVGGVPLAGIDFGGSGPLTVLLHALAGNADTWAVTASWLVRYGQVVAFDARGHGASGKPDGPYDTDARVGDAIAVVEQLSLGPAVLIGHSMGGITAWQAAGRRPDLVLGVVIGDISARSNDASTWWRDWLASWPRAFDDQQAIREYFDDYFGDEEPGIGDFFADVFVHGDDGWRPPFTAAHILALRESWNARDLTAELDSVKCPALVVKGALSGSPPEELQAMAQRLPRGEYSEVADAGHVLHYANPAGWRRAVEPFIARRKG